MRSGSGEHIEGGRHRSGGYLGNGRMGAGVVGSRGGGP